VTDAQTETRSERIAIMTIDGGLSENEAMSYCDSTPFLHGIRERDEKTGNFFRYFFK